jgi:hypothetical protein
MGFIEDMFKGNIVTGLVVGIGALIFAPVVASAAAGMLKPVAKAGIKGGLRLYESGKESIAGVGEAVDDLLAEAKSELHREKEGGAEARLSIHVTARVA